MAISERIHFFRLMRGMTQKYLGTAIGFPEKSADVRLAQYETGTRKPKADLTNALAQVLDVSPQALDVPDIDSYIGLMHTLFTLEDIYGLTVSEADGEVCLKVNKDKGREAYELLKMLYAWKEQADKLKTTLEQVKLIPPVDLKPFVYVRISEHPDIPLEEAMPLNQAVELFGKLDRQAVEEKDMAGYYKTHFEICFLSEGEVMSYTGRQDFGDGEGNLLDHVKAFADYYLHTEEGQQLMKQTARTTEEWEHEQQQMRWVLEEMLPTLQYFCNLEKLETAVLEEQEIEKKVPLLTQGDASRKAYQEAMLAYIRESRIALNTGKELPCMPDIRDFATACPDKSYKEQVMEEIRQEAESYGMTVEAYAANGYEPPKRGGR